MLVAGDYAKVDVADPGLHRYGTTILSDIPFGLFGPFPIERNNSLSLILFHIDIKVVCTKNGMNAADHAARPGDDLVSRSHDGESRVIVEGHFLQACLLPLIVILV